MTTSSGSGVGAPEALSGLRVLLVDDSVDALDAFSELLELEGANVVTASSGEQALAHIEHHRFDLLISDIAMPGMDGYELLMQLRDDPRTADLPAIALSGYGWGKEENLRAGARGFDAHLAKPVLFDHLLDVIEKLRGAA
jgi:two-component system CheB/CheR fusion protein